MIPPDIICSDMIVYLSRIYVVFSVIRQYSIHLKVDCWLEWSKPYIKYLINIPRQIGYLFAERTWKKGSPSDILNKLTEILKEVKRCVDRYLIANNMLLYNG